MRHCIGYIALSLKKEVLLASTTLKEEEMSRAAFTEVALKVVPP